MKQRPFWSEAAITLLTTFILTEVVSSRGWSSSPTSNLFAPVNRIASVTIMVSGLLGIYGLLKRKKTITYFAYGVAILEILLGSNLLVTVFKSYILNPTSLLLSIVAGISGTLTLLCLFQSNAPSKRWQQTHDGSPQTLSIKEYTVDIIDATKRYDLGQTSVIAIDKLNIKVRRGEFLAIMGPSGSGKSTLLNLIGALDKPSSGHIRIDGVDISTLDDRGLAKLRNEKIGFIFQSYNLIDRTKVSKNIELPAMVRGYSKGERQKKIFGLLRIVGIDNKADRKPKTLSGGEQQRVAIARALVNDPKIVLADEPTGNLDTKTGHEILESLRKMSQEKGTTMIIVTHNPEIANMADRTIYLRDGRIVEEIMGRKT